MKWAIKGLEGASCAYSLSVCAIPPGRGRVKEKCAARAGHVLSLQVSNISGV